MTPAKVNLGQQAAKSGAACNTTLPFRFAAPYLGVEHLQANKGGPKPGEIPNLSRALYLMVPIHKPQSLIEVAMARSILAAHDIPYFIHNGGYASLYPGIQIELLNVPTVMVPPSAAETARELLRAYLPDVVQHLRPQRERSAWHIARMLTEAIFCTWFVRKIGAATAEVLGASADTDGDDQPMTGAQVR